MHTAQLRTFQRMTHWIALFAILWHALMPSLSQARPMRPVNLPQEICTAFGLKILKPVDTGSPGHGTLHASQASCPFCLSDGPLALPPAAPLAFSLGGATSAIPSQPKLGLAPSRRWNPASPRAPPGIRL